MERLIKLYEATFGCTPTKTEAITGSGSSRLYFRLATERNSAIGVIGNCQEENNAFIGITRHFLEKGLPVPTIYNVSPDVWHICKAIWVIARFIGCWPMLVIPKSTQTLMFGYWKQLSEHCPACR